MKLPIQFRKEQTAVKKQPIKNFIFGSMPFITILLGLFLCFSITMQGIKYFTNSPEDTAIGELAFSCNSAMIKNGIRDNGGCRCIATAALKDKILPPKRTHVLKTYFKKLENSPNTLDGKIPSPLEISREIGLIYGHPFLRAYGNCSTEGFQGGDANDAIAQ